MHEIDLDNCRKCEESQCIMSPHYGKTKEKIEAYNQEQMLLKKLKEMKEKKLIDYYNKENKTWEEFKKRELSLLDYDRKPYMNESDIRHDRNWDLAINSQMDLQEKHYNRLEILRNAKLEDLI